MESRIVFRNIQKSEFKGKPPLVRCAREEPFPIYPYVSKFLHLNSFHGNAHGFLPRVDLTIVPIIVPFEENPDTLEMLAGSSSTGLPKLPFVKPATALRILYLVIF